MKIYGNKPPEGGNGNFDVKNVSKAAQKDQAPGVEKTRPADKVEISGEGKKAAELMAVINQMPDVRNDKVNAIKASIESGTYTVDPSKIAQKLLKEI